MSSKVCPRRFFARTPLSLLCAPSSTEVTPYSLSTEIICSSMASGRVLKRIPEKAPRRTHFAAGSSRLRISSSGIMVKLPPKNAISVLSPNPRSCLAALFRVSSTSAGVGTPDSPVMEFWSQNEHRCGQPIMGTKNAMFACFILPSAPTLLLQQAALRIFCFCRCRDR